MIEFSLDIKTAMLSGGNIMEGCYQKYISGDRSAIMTALIYCSLMQSPIPAWVADELLTIDKQVADGRFRDMNEFFNFGKPEHKTTLEFLSNVKTKNKRVTEVLFHHKVNGGEFLRHDCRGSGSISKCSGNYL